MEKEYKEVIEYRRKQFVLTRVLAVFAFCMGTLLCVFGSFVGGAFPNSIATLCTLGGILIGIGIFGWFGAAIELGVKNE